MNIKKFANYITESESSTTETPKINYDKWRRVSNEKTICQYIFYTQDPFGNKHRYFINVKYKEKKMGDSIYLSDMLLGNSDISHAISNMQNKPTRIIPNTSEDSILWTTSQEDAFNKNVIDILEQGDIKKAETAINKILKGQFDNKDFVKMIKDWLNTGTESLQKYEFKIVD